MGSFLAGAVIAALVFLIFVTFFRLLGHEWAGWLTSVCVVVGAILLFSTAPSEEVGTFIGGLVVGSLATIGVLNLALPPTKGGP